MGRTLYATEDQTRFFAVPDEAALPEGDFEVRSLTGRALRVDPTVLDVYEVSEDEAKALAREQLEAFGRKLKGVLGVAANALKSAARPDPADVAAREKRVAESLKLSEEELRDPAKVASAVKDVLGGVLQAAKDSVGDPEAAKARMKDVAEALRQQGAGEEAAAKVEQLPELLRDALKSDELLAALDNATEKLRAAARELSEETEREKLVRQAKGREPGEA